MSQNRYVEGHYEARNPRWHVEESPWKAEQILRILRKHNRQPRTICEVGCGAGEILSHLYNQLPSTVVLHGYDISPHAIELCKKHQKPRLAFHLGDLLQEEVVRPFDLVLTIDVIEHVEDYFGFLRKLRPRGRQHVFHIPLEISVQTVLRCSPILRAREQVGHLHSFTKETALATLADTGYEIVDYFYTAASIEPPNRSVKQQIGKLPRRVAYRLNADWAVRILGGYSLLVLAQ